MSYLREITERYRLERLLHSSGASSVFLAYDATAEEEVALKLISTGQTADSAPSRARFLRFAETYKPLRHPALPVLRDFGFTPTGSAFLALEYLPGQLLGQLKPAPPRRLLPLLARVAGGVAAMAEAGLAHRNLTPENLLVIPDTPGEGVKILGLGSPVFTPAAASPFAAPELEGSEAGEGPPVEEAWRADLHSLARILCHLLHVRVASAEGKAPEVQMPAEVAEILRDADALRSRLEVALRRDPARRAVTLNELRGALEIVPAPSTEETGPIEVPAAEVGEATQVYIPAEGPDTGDGVATRIYHREGRGDDPEATRVMPVEPPPLPPPGQDRGEVTQVMAPPELPPPDEAAGGKRPRAPLSPSGLRGPFSGGRRILWIGVGVAAALVLVAGILLLPAGDAPPSPPPPPAPAPGPPPAPPKAAQALAPFPSRLVAARDLLAEEDYAAAWRTLESIPPEVEATFSPEACETYQWLWDVLRPLRRDQLRAELERVLRRGDVRGMGAVVGSISRRQEEALAADPEIRRRLAAARRVLAAHEELEEARRGEDPVARLEGAMAFLEVLPGYRPAEELREEAASALEGEAEDLTRQGRFEEALERLLAVRRLWPDRPRLERRLDRFQIERETDERLAEVVAEAAARGEAGRPSEGLEALAASSPNRRFEEEFDQLRRRLRSQLERLDARPPTVEWVGEPDYRKDEALSLVFDIADDYEVVSVRLMARVEGGTYRELPLTATGGSRHTATITPDFHANENLQFYVEATDLSGHRGRLGNAEAPVEIERKKWFQRIFSGG